MKAIIKLRKFLPSDLDHIIEIERASFLSGGYSKKRFQSLYAKHAEDFILASVAGRPVGYILAYPKNSYLDLNSIAVDKFHRGLGIGGKLISFILLKSQKRGVKKAVLEVRTTNKSAISLYKKFGFRVTKILKRYYKDGGSAYKMEKILKKVCF